MKPRKKWTIADCIAQPLDRIVRATALGCRQINYKLRWAHRGGGATVAPAAPDNGSVNSESGGAAGPAPPMVTSGMDLRDPLLPVL